LWRLRCGWRPCWTKNTFFYWNNQHKRCEQRHWKNTMNLSAVAERCVLVLTVMLKWRLFSFRRCPIWPHWNPLPLGRKLIHRRYKYKQYIVKHKSMILLRYISYIFSFNDMFRLQLWAIFRLITFLSKEIYIISNAIVIVTYEISYNT